MGFFKRMTQAMAEEKLDHRQMFLDAMEAIAGERGLQAVTVDPTTPLGTPTDVDARADTSTLTRLVERWPYRYEVGRWQGSLTPGTGGSISIVWRERHSSGNSGKSYPERFSFVVNAELASSDSQLGRRAAMRLGGGLAALRVGTAGTDHWTSLFSSVLAETGGAAVVTKGIAGSTKASRARITFARDLGEDLPARLFDTALLDRFAALPGEAQFELRDGVVSFRLTPSPWRLDRVAIDETIDTLLALATRIS